MTDENIKKIKDLEVSSLNMLFSDWERTRQLDPFDILLYGRTGEPTAVIRRIDGDCGLLKPLTLHCSISTKENLEDGIEELNFVDPDDGPYIGPGVFNYNGHKVIIQEIYLKSKSFYIVFYSVQ